MYLDLCLPVKEQTLILLVIIGNFKITYTIRELPPFSIMAYLQVELIVVSSTHEFDRLPEKSCFKLAWQVVNLSHSNNNVLWLRWGEVVMSIIVPFDDYETLLSVLYIAQSIDWYVYRHQYWIGRCFDAIFVGELPSLTVA